MKAIRDLLLFCLMVFTPWLIVMAFIWLAMRYW